MRRGKSGMSKCRELSHWPKIGPAKWILARIPIKCRFWGIQNGLLQKVTTNLGSESLGMRYATPDKKTNPGSGNTPSTGSTAFGNGEQPPGLPSKKNLTSNPQKNQGRVSDLYNLCRDSMAPQKLFELWFFFAQFSCQRSAFPLVHHEFCCQGATERTWHHVNWIEIISQKNYLGKHHMSPLEELNKGRKAGWLGLAVWRPFNSWKWYLGSDSEGVMWSTESNPLTWSMLPCTFWSFPLKLQCWHGKLKTSICRL